MKHCMLGVLVSALAISGCARPASPTREFPLTGEVLAIKPDRTEITVKHDDVEGFMQAMTMPFAIKDPAQVAGLAPGDLIAATLVLTNEDSYLTGITKTGTVPPDKRGTIEKPRAGLAPGDPVPDLGFTTDDGRATSLAAERGAFVLVTFIYTRCPLPDYCPRMNKYFKGVQDALARLPQLRRQVRLLSLSFDPDFDTPARLKDHAATVGADPAVWRFATAPRERIDAFGALFGLTVVREGADGSNITHNLRTVLVGRDGTLVKTYNGSEWSPAEVVKDLETEAARR